MLTVSLLPADWLCDCVCGSRWSPSLGCSSTPSIRWATPLGLWRRTATSTMGWRLWGPPRSSVWCIWRPPRSVWRTTRCLPASRRTLRCAASDAASCAAPTTCWRTSPSACRPSAGRWGFSSSGSSSWSGRVCSMAAAGTFANSSSAACALWGAAT